MSPIIPDYTRQQDGSRQEDRRREIMDAETAADRERLSEDTYVGFGL